MNRSLLPRSLRALVLVLTLLLVSGSAYAQKQYTYSPTSHVVMRTSDGSQKTQYVSVKNETHSPIKMNFFLYGDTTIKFGYAPYYSFTIQGDSALSVPITYRAWTGDTSQAILYLTDSMSTPDTIGFTGIDTGYTLPVWQLLTQSAAAGVYYSLPDTAQLVVRNNTNSAITITSSFGSGSAGFSLVGSSQITVSANATTSLKYAFDAEHYNVAQATVNLSGAGISAQAYLYGRNATPPVDTLYIPAYFDIGTAMPGDTICRSFSIYNDFDTAAALTQLSILQNSPFFVSDPTSLPLIINAYDSAVITICYVAPATAGVNSNSYMNVNYTLGSWEHGATVYLHGATYGCFRASADVLNFGSIPRYDSLTHVFYLHNLRDVSTEITLSITPSNSGFEILTASPIELAAHDSAEVAIRFIATGSDSHGAKLVLDGSDNCGQVELTLLGRVYDSSVVVDSNSIALYGDESHELSFEGDSTLLSARYVFFNDQTDTITVKSIWLTQATHVSIANIEPRGIL